MAHYYTPIGVEFNLKHVQDINNNFEILDERVFQGNKQLEEVLTEGAEAIDALEALGGMEAAVELANATKEAMEIAITESNNSKVALDASKVAADNSKTALDGAVTTAGAAKTALDTSNTAAANTKTALDASKVAADNSKTALDNSKSAADASKANLDGSITTAGTTKTALDASNTTATNTKAAVDTAVTAANTAKSNLEQSTTEANAANATLAGTVADAHTSIGEMDATNAAVQVWEPYNNTKAYVPLNKVFYNGRSYVNKVSCTGVLPTDTSKWQLIADKGQDGAGGDMFKATYDTDNSGVVDDAEKLGGHAPAYYATAAQSDATAQEVQGLKNTIESGVNNSLSLTYGMQNIKHTGKFPIYPKIEVMGKHYVNILEPKTSDCEDLSKWSTFQCTPTLDASNKVFGSNGIKLTLTATTGTVYVYPKGIDPSKYYLLTGYIKNGNATRSVLRKSNDGGGTSINSTEVTDTTKFTRVLVKATPAQMNAGNAVAIDVVGTSGQYIYIDGIMLNEITAADYALTDAELMAKYPYVESYGALENPYFEVKRGNLVMNGNGEEGVSGWQSYNGYDIKLLTLTNRKITLTNCPQWQGIKQVIPVKKNTYYYIKGTTSANFPINIVDADTNTLISNMQNASFSTGNYSRIAILIQHTSTGAATGTIEEIMLVEGTTAPASYIPCELKRFVINGKLTNDDRIVIEDGKVSGLLWWKHRMLFGKDFDWTFSGSITGSKAIYAPNTLLNSLQGPSAGNILIKYDGVKCNEGAVGAGTADNFNLGSNINLGVANTNTGWAESINPNNDEVKAFMNGWKATANDGTRYTQWVSAIDGTTTPAAQTIDYVKSNVAPGYEGYRLHYKLATPEPVTDTNLPVSGTVWTLDPGDNYVYVDSGMVLGEVAKAAIGAEGKYYINSSGLLTNLIYRAEYIFSTYKNGGYDSEWVYTESYDAPRGRGYVAIPGVSFDPNATYTVDYQILKTLHAQSFGSLTMQYSQDLVGAFSSIAGTLENKQKSDSALDDLIGLSLYEESTIRNIGGRGVRTTTLGGSVMLFYNASFMARKHVVPRIILKELYVYARDNSGVTTLITPDHVITSPITKDGFVIVIYIKNGTNADNVLNNGGSFFGTYIADCNRRV